MAQVNRKARYMIEYLANTGPLRRVIQLQQQLNARVHAGSAAVNTFGNRIRSTFSSVSAQISRVTAVTSALGNAFSNVSRRIRNSLVTTRFEVAAMGAVISGVLTKLSIGGIRFAAQAEDIKNQFDISFSQVYEQATKVAEKMRQELRLSEITIKGFLSSTQDLLVGFGMTQQAALGLSEQVVRLTLDLASWNNVPFDTAMHNMLSGLVGNHEALRSLRIIITQATLERKKEELGIKGTWKSLSEATKVYLRYKVAVQQSVNAIGDLQRTSQETNNRFRFFTEQIKEATLKIFPKLTYWIGSIAEKFAIWMLNNEKTFTEIGDYIARLGWHLDEITDVVLRFMSGWEGLHRATKELAIFSSGVAGIAIPILGILVIFGRALSVVSLWYGVLLAVSLALQDIYAVMNGGNGYFKQFLDYTGLTTNQVRAFIDSMKNLGTSFITTVRESTLLRDVFNGVWNILVITADVIINDIIPVLKMLWDTIADSTVLQSIISIFSKLITMTLKTIGLVASILTGNTERITKYFFEIRTLFFDMLKDLSWGIFTGIVSIITNIIPNILRGLVSTIMNIIGQVLSLITHFIVGVFSTIFNTVKAIIGGIVGLITSFFKGLFTLARAVAEIFKWVFENTITKVIDGVLGGITAAIDKIKGLKKYLPDWVQKRLDDGADDVGTTPAGNPVIKPEPIIPTTKATLGASTGESPLITNTYATNEISREGVSVTMGDISMPIYLPEGFTGDAEEFRKIAAAEAERVFGTSVLNAFDDQSGDD